MKGNANDLITECLNKSIEETLKFIIGKYGNRTALASSLSAEDQVLTDMMLKIYPNVRIFIIDTGRLHQETYDTINETMKRYSMKYEVYFPETNDVELMESAYGPNLFYECAEYRKKCCDIRKVKPLKRVLSALETWITGQRREQSITREGLDKIEFDDVNNLIKINPLADWSSDMVWDYIRKNNVPYNALHDKNYPSIGCVPCTRAVKPGEDIRAGRWWWESAEDKECGLHSTKKEK